MGDTRAYVDLVAYAVEALVWLVLAIWCLQRMQQHPWARLAALGGVAMLVPAVTLTSARAQLVLGGDSTILENYVTGPLPTVYALLRVTGAALLLLALAVGRPGAVRPIRPIRPIADASGH